MFCYLNTDTLREKLSFDIKNFLKDGSNTLIENGIGYYMPQSILEASACGPENIEDIAFLDRLSRCLEGHRKILLYRGEDVNYFFLDKEFDNITNLLFMTVNNAYQRLGLSMQSDIERKVFAKMVFEMAKNMEMDLFIVDCISEYNFMLYEMVWDDALNNFTKEHLATFEDLGNAIFMFLGI